MAKISSSSEHTDPPTYSVENDENHSDQPDQSQSTSLRQTTLQTDVTALPLPPSPSRYKSRSVFELIIVALLSIIAGYVLRGGNSVEWKQKAELRWIDLTPEKKCLSYEKRMYTAKLAYVPDHTPGNEWCWTVPINIHGDVYNQPEWCGIKDGEVVGQWHVDKNEPSCHTWFKIIDDEETCVHGVSHTRRYFGKLENFNSEDWGNWRVMCATTPFKVRNLTFERPHQCGFRKLSWIGAWGTVDVQDDTCPE